MLVVSVVLQWLRVLNRTCSVGLVAGCVFSWPFHRGRVKWEAFRVVGCHIYGKVTVAAFPCLLKKAANKQA